MKDRFVHLHNHTEYSFGRGMLRIGNPIGGSSEFLRMVVGEGMPAVAITDRDNLHGAIEFYQACRKEGIKPIIGCEMSITKDACLTILARDTQGYQNLMALSSKAFLRGGGSPRASMELLAEHAKGLIMLSGGLDGPLGQALSGGDIDGACRLAAEYRDMLDDGCFFIELMDHGSQKEEHALKGLLEVHERTEIPLVATNDSRYLHKGDAAAYEVFLCIHADKRMSDADRPRMGSAEFYFKTAQEMARLFRFAPESLANTVRIARMCDLEIPMDQPQLPDFPVPDGFTHDPYLNHLCRRGLERLGLADGGQYARRMDVELGIIGNAGISSFFLIVWDLIRYAKEHAIPVGPGRGSSGGSLVAYVLGITAVDPLRYGLLFERFFNLDRHGLPDIDIDVAENGREKVIEYVRKKYGRDCVAKVVTFGAMHARNGLRCVGRALGIPLSSVDRIAKLVPPGSSLAAALAVAPELARAAKGPKAKRLLILTQKLEGLKWCTGVHAAGIVITNGPVWKSAPVARSLSDVLVTQYDSRILTALGLVKMDILSLRQLTRIETAVELVRAEKKRGFNLAKIPMDDAKTFELIAAGETHGVFQLDSEGFQAVLRRIRPTTFEDVSAAIVLYRPGPMASGLLDLFIACKQGKRVHYHHPGLEPILRSTYGCMIYQEQAMEIAKSLASFSPSEADDLRKTMGKKIPERMKAQRSRFMAGARKNGVATGDAARVFDVIETFGGYAFNKSHAVAYGMIAYQMAYLKANYPEEFAAAIGPEEL